MAISKGTKETTFKKEVIVILDEAEELMASNNIAEAMSLFSKALDLNGPHPYLFAKKGYANLCEKKYASAIDDFNSALNLKNNAPLTFFYRAQAKECVGDLKGALRDYESSLQIDSENFEAYCAIGLIQEYSKNYQAAKAAYTKALIFDPGNCIAEGGLENIRIKGCGDN